jgi:exosortase/archaeosortase family protein
LRSLVVMTALAAPYAFFTQRDTPRKWALFLLSVPLAVVANVTRIVTIAVVAQAAGIEAAMRLYHDFSGYLVFAVAALLLVSAGRLVNADFRKRFSQWKQRLKDSRPTPSS